MQWSEKYRPRKFGEICGQDETIKKLRSFIENFPNKKSLILYGPAGTGKSTLAYVIAYETDSEIFELNASDFRNRDKIKEILRPAIEQKSLTKDKKIILIDEVDGISGYADFGGVIEILKLINQTNYPVISTANDVWKKNLSGLRKVSEIIKLRKIDHRTIKRILIDILRKENKFLMEDVLTQISIKANGDLRAAINDLQAVSRVEDASTIDFDERNKEIDIFNSLRHIFKDPPTNELLKIFDSVNMNIDEIILWIEENIPKEYQGEELVRAYERLSKTDIFKGRIYKQQYWRFLIYENILLSYGISASKNLSQVPRSGFTSYKRPTRILKIWLNNQRTALKKSISQKYSKYVHIGEKRAMSEFPIIKQIVKSNQEIQKELRLTEEEVDYLNK